MKTVFLQISKGQFFEYSKDAKEGYEAYVNSSNIQKGYRKYSNEVRGQFLGCAVKENNMKGMDLQIYVGDQDTMYVISTNLTTQGGTLTSYVENFVSSLKTIRINGFYSFLAWHWAKDASNPRDRYGLAVRLIDTQTGEPIKLTNEQKFSTSFYKKDGTYTAGDIPAQIWSKSITGQNVVDAKANVEFQYAILQQFFVKPPYSSENSQSNYIPKPYTGNMAPTETQQPVQQYNTAPQAGPQTSNQVPVMENHAQVQTSVPQMAPPPVQPQAPVNVPVQQNTTATVPNLGNVNAESSSTTGYAPNLNPMPTLPNMNTGSGSNVPNMNVQFNVPVIDNNHDDLPF